MTGHAHPHTIAGVPTLIAEPAPGQAPLPVVLWFHGFRADALAHAGELERCAAAGFLAVGVDAVEHGARATGELDARLAASPTGALLLMLEIVERTVRELPALIDGLAERYPIDRDRISMVGISMGAFLVYRAVVTGPPMRAGVALLGSPEWPGETSPHRWLEAFRSVALLSITAEHDQSVAPEPVARLHAALGQTSPDHATHSYHYVLRGAGHLTSGEEWQRAMRVTEGWLRRFS